MSVESIFQNASARVFKKDPALLNDGRREIQGPPKTPARPPGLIETLLSTPSRSPLGCYKGPHPDGVPRCPGPYYRETSVLLSSVYKFPGFHGCASQNFRGSYNFGRQELFWTRPCGLPMFGRLGMNPGERGAHAHWEERTLTGRQELQSLQIRRDAHGGAVRFKF